MQIFFFEKLLNTVRSFNYNLLKKSFKEISKQTSLFIYLTVLNNLIKINMYQKF